MMKKYLFFAVILLLGLGACSNELDVPAQGGEENGSAQGYLSISLSAPQGLRTAGTTPAAPSEGNESKIDDVTIVLTEPNSDVIKYVKTPTLSGSSVKFEVALGTYDVYALVNNPVSVAAGQNLSRVLEAVSEAEVLSGYKNGKFFMVNAHNSSTSNAGVPVTIHANNTEVSPATATVYVDRIAAKIVDKNTYTEFTKAAGATPGNNEFATDGFPASVEKLKITGFAPLNINKKFNLIQTWGTLNANGGPALTTEVLQTPLPDYNTVLPKDLYYSHYNKYVTLNKDGSGNITEIKDLTVETDFTMNPVYTTENRPTILFYGSNNDLTAGRGETTGVIYRVEALDGSGAAVPTFYSYEGVFYTDLATIQALPAFTGETLTNFTVEQLRGKGIKVYENGVIYYTHFIKDVNPAHQYDSKNYYAILRNSVYQLTVNKFSQIGDDVPGGGTVDPEGPGGPTGPTNPPIDTDEAYIQVTVNINPWALNLIGIDF